jgi:uncharacterized protein YndB with AHSA1/START domain
MRAYSAHEGGFLPTDMLRGALGPAMADITIDAPRELVWATISDLALRPAFCDHFMDEFRLQRIDSTGVGAAARFRIEAPRRPMWMETVIEEADAPHRLIERGRGGRIDRIPVGCAWELTEGAGAGCEARVSFWTEPERPYDKVLDRLSAAGWYERQWKRALSRLRDLCESGDAAEPLRVAGASRP